MSASGFTHLWNASGFPDIFFDEGVYMRRAMHVLAGLGPQESYFHDHPFFGQIFLGTVLGLVGFPNAVHPSASPDSIAALYLVPRILMGLLAIADTFLVYKIAQNRYGDKAGLVSAMLFSVMPITWLVRRILLDSILLPFLLLSIFLALKSKDSSRKEAVIALSGICMGLAIFTKIPAFAFMPLVAGLVYFEGGRKARSIALWIIPVVLIPLLWPLQSVAAGEFHLWVGDVLGQAERHSYGLPYISKVFLQMDPVLFLLGIAGAAFCISRRDMFVLFGIVPFILFLLAIGYNQYFYWIPVLPLLCIAASVLVTRVAEFLGKKRLGRITPIVLVLGLAAFGLVSTAMLVSTNMTSGQYQAAAFVLHRLKGADRETTVLASPAYTWIFSYVFHNQNVFSDYTQVGWYKITTEKTLSVADPHYFLSAKVHPLLYQIYNGSYSLATFGNGLGHYDTTVYPYPSMYFSNEGNNIEVRERG